MKIYNLIVRRNKQEDEIHHIFTNGKYQAIKQTTEFIKQFLTDDFSIIQIRIEENNKLVCKFIPFTVTEQNRQKRKYSIGF